MNRKVLFLLFCCLCVAVVGNAQKFKGGFQVGLIASQVDGDKMAGYHKPGLFAGGFVNLPFHDNKMKIQLEIDYAQKGSRSNTISSLYKLKLHQIEVPVLYDWNCWGKVSLEAGLSFNMLVKVKEYSAVSGELIEPEDGDFNFFELGLLAGANYCFKDHYRIAFRYNWSITPVGKSSYYRMILFNGLRNNAIQFNLCYQF
jgi:hypothetical protein